MASTGLTLVSLAIYSFGHLRPVKLIRNFENLLFMKNFQIVVKNGKIIFNFTSRYYYSSLEKLLYIYCAAGFALLNLPKGKSLGRSKPETNSSNEQAHATHCVGFLLYPSPVELPYEIR